MAASEKSIQHVLRKISGMSLLANVRDIYAGGWGGIVKTDQRVCYCECNCIRMSTSDRA